MERAEYILKTGATLRQAASHFGVGKSTIHTDMRMRLKRIDGTIYRKVGALLAAHWEERYLRGGEGTARKYRALKHKKEGD